LGPPDSSPPPAPPGRVSQVKSSNSSSKGNQSMLDSPFSALPAAEPTPIQPSQPQCSPFLIPCLQI
jgi:hypothetical protein